MRDSFYLNDLDKLNQARLPNGLFTAGPGHEQHGLNYEKIWIRDNVYTALAYEAIGDVDTARQVYHGLLDILHRVEAEQNKIARAIERRPVEISHHIHAVYSKDGFELPGDWGHKQHDAIGIFLFGLGRMYQKDPSIIRHQQDSELVELLVRYLRSVRYWEDPDNGMWEEMIELHSSSISACVKGLEAVQTIVNVSPELIDLGRQALAHLLPREAPGKSVDMAQLSLVWPLGYKNDAILAAVEQQLLQKQGVWRYKNDDYHRVGSVQAEWTMGIPWLGLAWLELGDKQKAQFYLDWTDKLYTDGKLPEAYIDGQPCDHTPLTWSHGLALILRHRLADSA